MGLDIYLYDGDTSPEWREDMTEAERSEWLTAIRASTSETDVKSERFPQHTCGPRYLRSSYNGGGFNSVVDNLIGRDLYWIMEPKLDEEADWRPTRDELTAARERAVQAQNELVAVKVPLASFGISAPFPSDRDGKAAIKLVTEALERRAGEHDFRSYSSRDGYFYLDGIEILGLIHGRDFFRECVHVVHKLDVTYYLEMCEIIIEFIDTALTMERPRVVWSG